MATDRLEKSVTSSSFVAVNDRPTTLTQTLPEAIITSTPPPPFSHNTAATPSAPEDSGAQEDHSVPNAQGGDAVADSKDTERAEPQREVGRHEGHASDGAVVTRSYQAEASLAPAQATSAAAPARAAPSVDNASSVVTPESLARQLADFRVAPAASTPPAPPARAAEPDGEEEWLLKSIAWPPLPPTPFEAGAGGADYAHGFETDERLRVRIICQNANGPCSLIALCNVLILRNDLTIAPGRTSVSYSFLSNVLADYFLRATSSPSSPGAAASELSLEAALSILPQTRYGINLNPRFDCVDGFASSSPSKGELALFSLARVPLLHGWLADPSSPETYDALVGAGGCGDYDTALERVVEGAEIAGGAEALELREEELSEEEVLKEAERRSKWSAEEERKVRQAYLINTFLSATSTQLTYPGLSALCSTPSLLPPSGLAALFRNSHLSVLYRRPTLPASSTVAQGPELFTLVTDAAFAGEEDIVWESMADVDGSECTFFDAALKRSSVRGGDWVVSGGERGGGRRPEPVMREGMEDAADVALAQQLQAEEDAHERHLVERARASNADRPQHRAERPTSAYSSASSAGLAPPVRTSEPAGRADHAGTSAGTAGGGKAAKRLSRLAGSSNGKPGGRGDKDKCVVM